MKRATAKALVRHPRELFLVANVLLFLLHLPLLLRVSRIQDIVAKITPRGSKASRRPLDSERVTYLCERSMARLERFGYRRSCLKRCLMNYRFLRAEGVPVVINFGASWEGGILKGHSWLTLDGALYHEPQEKVDRFVHFFSLPSAGGGAPDGSAGTEESKNLGQARFD